MGQMKMVRYYGSVKSFGRLGDGLERQICIMADFR